MLVKHYTKQISIYVAGKCAAHAVTTTKCFREKRCKLCEAQRLFGSIRDLIDQLFCLLVLTSQPV